MKAILEFELPESCGECSLMAEAHGLNDNLEATIFNWCPPLGGWREKKSNIQKYIYGNKKTRHPNCPLKIGGEE